MAGGVSKISTGNPFKNKRLQNLFAKTAGKSQVKRVLWDDQPQYGMLTAAPSF
jgi:hypothetical protein